jgi:hypothetical protein
MAQAFKNLTLRQIVTLANQYGFRPHDRTVLANAKQADEYHGEKAQNFDGDLKRFWGCDSAGNYNAYRLLDGYLSEESRVMRCDALAARQFERDAYGY